EERDRLGQSGEVRQDPLQRHRLDETAGAVAPREQDLGHSPRRQPPHQRVRTKPHVPNPSAQTLPRPCFLRRRCRYTRSRPPERAAIDTFPSCLARSAATYSRSHASTKRSFASLNG